MASSNKTNETKRKEFVENVPTSRDQDTNISSEDNVSNGVILEDIDRSFHKAINDVVDSHVRTNKGWKKVKVLFSTKERWAAIRNNTGVRDANGRLILPLITVTRTNHQRSDSFIYSGLNEVTIAKRLHKHSIYNKKSFEWDERNTQNKNFASRHKNTPLYEYITFPNAATLEVTYDVSFWTDYMQQNNTMYEQTINKFGYANEAMFHIFTDSGFHFPAKLESTNNESNLEEFSEDEKVIKHTLSYTVFPYLIDSEKIKRSRSVIEVVLEDKIVSAKEMQDLGLLEETLSLDRKLF